MKKILIGLVVILLLLGGGAAGYVYYLSTYNPEPEKDVETAEKVSQNGSTQALSFSNQLYTQLPDTEVKREDGTSVSVKDLFVETERGIMIPKESEIANLDLESCEEVVTEMLYNSTLDAEAAMDYLNTIKDMPAVQAKLLEAASKYGLKLD